MKLCDDDRNKRPEHEVETLFMLKEGREKTQQKGGGEKREEERQEREKLVGGSLSPTPCGRPHSSSTLLPSPPGSLSF